MTSFVTKTTVTYVLFLGLIGDVFAEAEEESVFHLSGVVGIAEPEVDQRDVIVPNIDTEDFEIGLYVGTVNIENLGSSIIGGIRFSVHATEDLFLEGAYGRASATDEAYRSLQIANPPLDGREVNVDFYSFSVGYNILPGEMFLGGDRVLTSAAYTLLGIGSTRIDGEGDFTTVILGMGLRILPNDWLSIRFEAKGYEFESDVVTRRKYTHNVETSFSIGIFF